MLKNTTPVPNIFFDEIIGTLSGSAIRVYLKIVRTTYGWRDANGNVKQRDWISHSQFEKYGVSNRSVTNGVQELLDRHLIIVTDQYSNNLRSPHLRKQAKKVYYALNPMTNADTAPYNAKSDKTKPQKLQGTKEISLQKYSANERIPDHIRIGQIKDEEQKKQIQRDSWL